MCTERQTAELMRSPAKCTMHTINLTYNAHYFCCCKKKRKANDFRVVCPPLDYLCAFVVRINARQIQFDAKAHAHHTHTHTELWQSTKSLDSNDFDCEFNVVWTNRHTKGEKNHWKKKITKQQQYIYQHKQRLNSLVRTAKWSAEDWMEKNWKLHKKIVHTRK